MFAKSVKTILATAVIASTAAFSSVGAANAGSLNLYIGGPGVGVHVGGHRHRHHRYHRHHRRHHTCQPRRALNKAWRMGLNRPYVERVGRNRIVVKGYNYGHRAKVVFSRHNGRCPVIKTRGI